MGVWKVFCSILDSCLSKSVVYWLFVTHKKYQLHLISRRDCSCIKKGSVVKSNPTQNLTNWSPHPERQVQEPQKCIELGEKASYVGRSTFESSMVWKAMKNTNNTLIWKRKLLLSIKTEKFTRPCLSVLSKFKKKKVCKRNECRCIKRPN